MTKALGKYEILEELGAGSMSVLYRGRDTVLEREVAIKTIYTGTIDPELKERFYREARSCARLQHPHIVIVYDFGEQEGVAYIAMELLSGMDLRRIIARKRPFALETKLEILAQVCDGLAHAHSHDIVHRDVKPGNIFIQDDERAKVLDFGIARIPASQLTRVGSALGTPNYMAPEQITGRPCEARSDLFSAAIVLFEFLTYAHPFGGANIAWRIVTGEPDSLLSVNPALPAALGPVLEKGLSKEPDKRYQNGNEFAAALRAIRDEVRRDAVGLSGQVESLRAKILAGREQLAGFERCRIIQSALEEPGLDWTVLDNWPLPAPHGYLELAELRQRLGPLRQQQEKALIPAREALETVRRGRALLRQGDLEGCRQTVERLESDFADHPQVAALRSKLEKKGKPRAPRRAKLAAEAAGPEPPAAEASRPISQLLARLRHAAEEQDRSLMAELAGELRSQLDQTEGQLRSQAEEALLDADFELAMAHFGNRMQDSDLAGAENAFRQMEDLPLHEQHQIETRDRCWRQLEEARQQVDPTELRASEFLHLFSQFNAALGKRDAAKAAPALEAMRKLVAADERFAATVSECEKQFRELAGEAPLPVSTQPVSPILAALRQRAAQLLESKEYQQCIDFLDSLGSKNQADVKMAEVREQAQAGLERAAAAPPAPTKPLATPEPLPPAPSRTPGGEARLPFELPGRGARQAARLPPLTPPAPAPPPAVEPNPPPVPAVVQQQVFATPEVTAAPPEPLPVEEAPPVAAPPEPPPVETALQTRPPATPPKPLPQLVGRAATQPAGMSARQMAIIGVAAVAVLVMAGAIALRLMRSQAASLAPAQGSAEVLTAEARLLAVASPGAKLIGTLHRGDRVNVLELPASRQAQWVHVQFAGADRTLAPGYVQVADLGKWRSEDSQAALRLLKLFAPSVSAPEKELREQLDRLGDFVARFAITPQGPEANFEMARLNVLLARRAKEAGRPPSDWESHLDAATGQLAMAAGSSQLAAQVARARQDLDALRQVEKPPPPKAAAPQPAVRPEVALGRAETAWKAGRYRESLRILNQLLRDRPRYTPAIALRQKVLRAQKLESRGR